VRGCIVLYLVIVALAAASALPAGIALSVNAVRDTIASVVLLGFLCLHLVGALQRRQLTVMDVMLDASILAVVTLTLQSPQLAVSAFYLALVVMACLLPPAGLRVAIPTLLLANLLATLGLQVLWMASPDVVNQYALSQAWQLFCLDLVGIPALGMIIFALNRLLTEHEGELALASQARQQLQSQQRHLLIAEKMAALERLSDCIAHEMNNHLTAVVTSLDLIQAQLIQARRLHPDDQLYLQRSDAVLNNLHRWVESGRKAAIHSADFLRSLTDNARRSPQGRAEAFPLVTSLSDVTKLLQPLCEQRHCQLSVHIDEPDAVLYGESGKFSQVVMNLVHNAVDAYADAGAGSEQPIWITLTRRGEHLVLDVTDAGSGIASEHLAQVFDYHFTTKPAGKGTGLGLSIVHEIIVGHFGGSIDVHSRPGQGTTFTITFPQRPVDVSREFAAF
jgi:signal transduction histidine kinase